MHDCYVVEYNVNIREKELIIQICNNTTKKFGNICFSNVLTHSFKCILDYNQILDVHECELSSFINDNRDELIKLGNYCWPINYKTEQELISFLLNEKYKYIKIYSSYGMYGWVMAKSYRIDE